MELKPLQPLQAMEALRRRGGVLDPTFAWQDRWQEDHAAMFTVAKSAGFDILKDVHSALERTLSEGRTFRDFAGELTPVLQEKGWWGRQLVEDPQTGEPAVAQLGSVRRLQLIFDVNMRVSYAAGHWASFERNKATRPFLRYVAIRDERTRPDHMRRHNLVLPVDHSYWNTWAPPCGWNCRCTLQSLSARDVDRLKAEGEALRFEPPADVLRTWLNKRTGQEVRVPEGIDPGWAYNPGKAGWRAGLTGAEKLIEAPPELAAAGAEDPDWLRRPLGREFAEWFDQAAAGGPIERSVVAVGAIDASTLEALAARGIVPASGAVTIDQRTVRHVMRDAKAERGRTVPEEILRRLPDLLAAPLAILRDRRDDALVYVFDVPDNGVGKIVVRLDFVLKTREAGRRAVRIPVNSIRTAGIVEDADLRADVYELLQGDL